MFRSANTGATWTAITPTGGAANRPTFDLVRDPSNANRLGSQYAGLAGAFAGTEGVFISNNTGQTWTNVSVTPAAAERDPGSGNAGNGNNTNLELAVGIGGRVYAAVIQNNQPAIIAFSDNQGATWTQMELPVYPSTNVGLVGGVQRIQPSACGTPPCPILMTTTAAHNLPVGGSPTVQVGVRLVNNLGTAVPANGDFRATVVCNNDVPPGFPCVNLSTQFVLLGSALAAGNGCGGGGAQPACTGTWSVWNTTSPSARNRVGRATHLSLAVDPMNQNLVILGGDRQKEGVLRATTSARLTLPARSGAATRRFHRPCRSRGFPRRSGRT